MLNQRKIVLDALLKVGKDFGYSNLVLRQEFSKNNVPPEDKTFITALFYGVLDRIITLDYVISKYAKTEIKRIKPITLYSLRIAVYQILFMQKVPASAAVNESVNLVKHSKEKYNAAFVNALLRNLLRDSFEFPAGNSPRALQIRYSCPLWIVESLVNDYGIDNAKIILEHYLTVPKITLRINSVLISDDDLIKRLQSRGIAATRADAPHAVILQSGLDVAELPEYQEGLFHIEDLPSQIAVSELSVKAGERLLDMCAAPGGKTFTAAQNALNRANIVACDVFQHRVDLIAAGAKRLKIDNLTCLVKDSSTYDDTLGLFDAVICDVPCSGLGVIRRKPEIKYKTDPDLGALYELQKRILNNGLSYLKNGGRLLYSTCTVRKAENEEIVRVCLNKNSGFELITEKTFLPGVDGTDGFYYAIIKSR